MRLATAIVGARMKVDRAFPVERDRLDAEFREASATVDRWLNDASTADVGEEECVALLEFVGRSGW